MKILELEKLLPRINEDTNEVDTWYDEFTRLMALADITSQKSVYTWALESVDGKLRGAIQELHEEDSQEYPSIKEIKKVLEEKLRITPQEKCKRLQQLRIQKGESISNFNWRYKKLYDSLSKFYQTFITVDDYVESIKFRPYARSQVITQRCEDLEEAFEEAELAERAEINKTSSRSTATVMTTLFNNNSFYRENVHPFRKFGSTNLISYYYSQNHNRNPRNDSAKDSDYRRKIHNVQSNPLINDLPNSSSYEKNMKFHNLPNTSIKRSTVCYRCGLQGHYYRHCPYSFKELAEMEERKQNNQAPLNL